MAFWIVVTTYTEVTKRRYDVFITFLTFKSLLGIRRALDFSPEVPVTLRIFVLFYELMFCTVSLFFLFRVQQCLFK